MHHPATDCFAWMHTCSNHDSLPLAVVTPVLLVGNCDYVTLFTSQCRREYLPIVKGCDLRIRFYLLEVPPHITESVRHTVREVDRVMVVCKRVGPGQGSVLLICINCVFPNRVVRVPYVVALLHPAYASLSRSLLRVNSDLHSIIEQRVWLAVVQNIELD